MTYTRTQGANGSGADANTILNGSGPPQSGDGLDDLDGVSDPWRWCPTWGGWIGPAYEVTWLSGQTVLDVSALTLAYTMLVVMSTTDPATVNDSAFNTQFFGGVANPAYVAGSDGSGVAYVVQQEIGYTHTVVPDASFDPLTVFGECTIVGPYTFPDDGDTGVDGDFYIDTTAHAISGPKAGAWPTAVDLVGADGADAVILADLDIPVSDIDAPTYSPDPAVVRLNAYVVDSKPFVRLASSDTEAYLTTSDDLDNYLAEYVLSGSSAGTLLVRLESDPSSPGLLAPGTDGQVLAADSSSDYGLAYVDPVVLPAGGTDGQVLSRDSGSPTGYAWIDLP